MFEWIKKHKVLLIFISISSLVVVPLVIHILFKIDVENSFFSAEWTAGEFLGYYGSVLSFVGTVVLGALALYQNNLSKMNPKNMSRLYYHKNMSVICQNFQ